MERIVFNVTHKRLTALLFVEGFAYTTEAVGKDVVMVSTTDHNAVLNARRVLSLVDPFVGTPERAFGMPPLITPHRGAVKIRPSVRCFLSPPVSDGMGILIQPESVVMPMIGHQFNRKH